MSITRVQVWITNKSNNYNESRNLVAFMDLGENKYMANDLAKKVSQKKMSVLIIGIGVHRKVRGLRPALGIHRTRLRILLRHKGRGMEAYYRKRNADLLSDDKTKEPFNIFDMNFALGPLEKIFGPGGVQLKTQGALVSMNGVTRSVSPSRV